MSRPPGKVKRVHPNFEDAPKTIKVMGRNYHMVESKLTPESVICTYQLEKTNANV